MTTELPDSVRALARFIPPEDILLPLLREQIPDIPIYSLIPPAANPFPMLVVRVSHSSAAWRGDARFLNVSAIAVHAFTEGPSSDQDGAILSEAVRVAMLNIARERRVLPGLGHVAEAVLTSPPRRVGDWATATGPVQYADLPSGTTRYESIYRVATRPPA